MNSTTIIIIAVVALILLIAIYIGATYNAFIKKETPLMKLLQQWMFILKSDGI